MLFSTLTLSFVLLASPELAEPVKSGPQVGEGVPGGFSTLFSNGEHADKRRCPV